MADRRRRCGCRLYLPGTDGREEAANQESAADLKGQPTVKLGALALHSVLGKCQMPAVLALAALSAFLSSVNVNRGQEIYGPLKGQIFRLSRLIRGLIRFVRI